jgi:hypothetical protein
MCPTECGLSECDREASTQTGGPGPIGAVEPGNKVTPYQTIVNNFKHRLIAVILWPTVTPASRVSYSESFLHYVYIQSKLL